MNPITPVILVTKMLAATNGSTRTHLRSSGISTPPTITDRPRFSFHRQAIDAASKSFARPFDHRGKDFPATGPQDVGDLWTPKEVAGRVSVGWFRRPMAGVATSLVWLDIVPTGRICADSAPGFAAIPAAVAARAELGPIVGKEFLKFAGKRIIAASPVRYGGAEARCPIVSHSRRPSPTVARR